MLFLSREFVVIASLESLWPITPQQRRPQVGGRINVGPRPSGPFASRGSGWGGSQRFGADSRRMQSLRTTRFVSRLERAVRTAKTANVPGLLALQVQEVVHPISGFAPELRHNVRVS